jgi:hypothetical protein
MVKVYLIIVIVFSIDLTLEIKLVHGDIIFNVSEGMDHQKDGH